MQRTPLEELVLQLRLLELGDHPGDFLHRAPEPPALEEGIERSDHAAVQAVERAIRALAIWQSSFGACEDALWAAS